MMPSSIKLWTKFLYGNVFCIPVIRLESIGLKNLFSEGQWITHFGFRILKSPELNKLFGKAHNSLNDPLMAAESKELSGTVFWA